MFPYCGAIFFPLTFKGSLNYRDPTSFHRNLTNILKTKCYHHYLIAEKSEVQHHWEVIQDFRVGVLEIRLRSFFHPSGFHSF